MNTASSADSRRSTRDGEVLDRFAPTTTPDALEPDVEAALRT